MTVIKLSSRPGSEFITSSLRHAPEEAKNKRFTTLPTRAGLHRNRLECGEEVIEHRPEGALLRHNILDSPKSRLES